MFLRVLFFIPFLFFLPLFAVTHRDDVSEARYIKLAKSEHFAAVGLIQSPLGMSTGTLIDKKIVLTTAHSLVADNVVHFSITNPSTGKMEEFGGHPILHEDYIIEKDEKGHITHIANDIAIVILNKEITFVKPAKIDPDFFPLVDTEFTCVGYGKTGTGTLGQGGLDRNKRAFCNRFCEFMNWPLTERYLFSYFESPEEPLCCDLEGIAVGGDSGSPIFIESKNKMFIIGITSLLGGNGSYGSFNAILPISRYALWLEEAQKNL